MKRKILIALFILGFFAGLALTIPDTSITGTVGVEQCYAENQLCTCDAVECVCGDLTVPVGHCLSGL